jgi:hypothetical protein
MRLAKITTMQGANEFLEKEYWPEWNERLARPLSGMVDLHRPLTPQQDLAASLSHVDHRAITNDYTFSFAGRRYQIARGEVKGAKAKAMKGQPLRIELRLSGELRVRYKGQYLELAECAAKMPSAQPVPSRKPVRKNHNAGGKSHWMEGFFDRPRPELWQAIQIANAQS